MARTGIDIKVSNTTLGAAPQVNGNSMLVIVGATAATGGSLNFELGKAYLLHSPDDLETLGITAKNNPDIVNQVGDYYAPKGGVNNSGNVLWLVGVATDAEVKTGLMGNLRETVANGFQYRPRQIGVYVKAPATGAVTELVAADVQSVIDQGYTEGFSTVAVIGKALITGAIGTSYETLEDLSKASAPMVGTVIVTNRQGDGACVGAVLGFMASLSVGTSIGDSSLTQFAGDLYFVDGTQADENGAITMINTPCASVSLGVLNTLGDKQYIFARTRPPKNGLWFNDGATGEDAATALSTLEAGRTIASIVDDLRSYFTPYINGRVPVNTNGDIRSDYKQVVLDGANSKVIQPYIDSGDISGASLDIKAKNNDFIGTRTWEVTLQILPAFTLRWIDGYVFYVSSLS